MIKHSKYIDYILEFLEIDVRKLTQSATLLKKDKNSQIQNLNKGDIVEVKAIGEVWAKVEYAKSDKELITGFVKTASLNIKAPIPSFDPKKASTKIEKAICSDVVLASLDRQMLQAYKLAKKQNAEKVKKEQRAWVKARNKACKGLKGQALATELKKQYSSRLTQLRTN